MGGLKIIGTNALTYPEIRNFAGHAYTNFRFKKVFDFYKFPAYFLFKLKGLINRKWLNSYMDLGLNKVSFYHFFNVINLGNKPTIITFETSLPRWNDTTNDFKNGLEIIAKKNCVQLIALSQSAYDRQAMVCKKYRPDLLHKIMAKNRVILPPQINFINHINEKREPGKFIIFTIVGADFFRKGGQAILNAFEELITQNQPIHLNIVSTLNYGDYVSKTNIEDFELAVKLIQKYPNHISHFKSLSNESVKTLLLDTDVALLPSIAETFGYFILEAQAAGCPVITTDIRAMPEINSIETGWLIPIRKANSDEAEIDNPTALISKISIHLCQIINEILAEPSIVREKGAKALNNIIKNHSPMHHQALLESIYTSILQNE